MIPLKPRERKDASVEAVNAMRELSAALRAGKNCPPKQLGRWANQRSNALSKLERLAVELFPED